VDTAKRYLDSNENECSIWHMVRREPDWAANRIQEGERAIKEIAALKAELAQQTNNTASAPCHGCDLEFAVRNNDTCIYCSRNCDDKWHSAHS